MSKDVDYENKIFLHDTELYRAIKHLIHLIPDFRPQETAKLMKAEGQNNWKLIYNELTSLGYREDHMALVEAINSGKFLEIEDYLNQRDLVEDFFLSYPGLAWLMYHISPRATIQPLFISQGVNLSEELFTLIIDIMQNARNIKFIRDERTASYFFKKYPYIRVRNIDGVVERNSIGEMYWILQDPLFDPVPNNPTIRSSAEYFRKAPIEESARLGHTEILKILLKDPRFIVTVRALEEAIRKYQIEATKILLSDPRIANNQKYLLRALQAAMAYNIVEIINLLLLDYNIDIDNEIKYNIIKATEQDHLMMIETLLTIPGIEEFDFTHLLRQLTKDNNIEISRLLLNDPRIHFNYKFILIELYRAYDLGNTEIVKIFLKYPQTKFVFDRILIKALDQGDEDIVEMIVNDDLPIRYNNDRVIEAVKRAHERKDEKIVEIILNNPRAYRARRLLSNKKYFY